MFNSAGMGAIQRERIPLVGKSVTGRWRNNPIFWAAGRSISPAA